MQTFECSCPCSVSRQGISGPSSQTTVPWQHFDWSVGHMWVHLPFPPLVPAPCFWSRNMLTMTRGALQGAELRPWCAWKIIHKKRDGGGEGAEFHSAVLPVKPQASCQGQGIQHWGGTKEGEGRIRICLDQQSCQDMHKSDISWGAQSHLDTGTKVLSTASPISLSNPTAVALFPYLEDFLNSVGSVFIEGRFKSALH